MNNRTSSFVGAGRGAASGHRKSGSPAKHAVISLLFLAFLFGSVGHNAVDAEVKPRKQFIIEWHIDWKDIDDIGIEHRLTVKDIEKLL